MSAAFLFKGVKSMNDILIYCTRSYDNPQSMWSGYIKTHIGDLYRYRGYRFISVFISSAKTCSIMDYITCCNLVTRWLFYTVSNRDVLKCVNAENTYRYLVQEAARKPYKIVDIDNMGQCIQMCDFDTYKHIERACNLRDDMPLSFTDSDIIKSKLEFVNE
jgi:hypothetical protein